MATGARLLLRGGPGLAGLLRAGAVVGVRRASPGFNTRLLSTTATRNGGAEGWSYRQPYEYSQKDRRFLENCANIVMTFVWWWIFWHCITEPEHLFGEGKPNPKDWTDKELGIPPE